MCIIGALCAICGSAWAQETGNDANEAYVLQQARDAYAASSQAKPATDTASRPDSAQTATNQPSTGGASNADGTSRPEGRAYSPFVVGFVPGLSFPFGIVDTSLSAAWIGALTGSVHGLQGAGVFNISESTRGIQGAGVFNITGRVRGIQAAGVFNVAEEMHGIQASAVFNVAGEMHGIQAAGVFNVAGKASGVMLGLVNVADELDGIAFGFVNFIGNGIHDVSIDYQPASGMAYATYRSGTPFLYAAFSAGQPIDQFGKTSEGLTAGFALGHRLKILFLTTDIELGSELLLDPASAHRVGMALSGYDPFSSDDIHGLIDSITTFGTLRASFGFGKRKGFGPYMGIKADFVPSGSIELPGIMRSAFGSALPYTISFGNLGIDIWPKWFLGIKF